MILVCGGAGYIGSHAVATLLKEGRRVLVADNFSTGHRWAVPDQAVLEEGDLRDSNFLNRLCTDYPIDGVMHFAANSLVAESLSHPLRYYAHNVGGTLNLLQAMESHGIRRLVFSSTAAVYGEPAQLPVSEEAPLKPSNPYGETKRVAEQMIHWAHQAHGVQAMVLRYFNVAGADPDHALGELHQPETHLIPIVLEVALGKRAAVSIYGEDYPTPDGTCIRDYIHVCDLVRAHLLAMEALENGKEGKVYNLGNNRGFSVREIVDTARRVTGCEIPVLRAPRRPGDPARLVASSEKAFRELGWSPAWTHIDAIIGSAWQWHRQMANSGETKKNSE